MENLLAEEIKEDFLLRIHLGNNSLYYSFMIQVLGLQGIILSQDHLIKSSNLALSLFHLLPLKFDFSPLKKYFLIFIFAYSIKLLKVNVIFKVLDFYFNA